MEEYIFICSILIITRTFSFYRLYSDFLFFRKEKNTTYFHNDVKDTIEYMNSCFKNHTIRHCIYHAPPPDCIKVGPSYPQSRLVARYTPYSACPRFLTGCTPYNAAFRCGFWKSRRLYLGHF